MVSVSGRMRGQDMGQVFLEFRTVQCLSWGRGILG